MSEVHSQSSFLTENSLSLMDAAEAQLQQELRSMFAVDTQAYLQTYISLVQRLQPNSWTADIQELYRCIHTIKGGAVTVSADGILHVSTALEDLLSDLRYLQVAPILEDGKLVQMLLEAGELLTASLEVQAVGEAALLAVQPTIERLLVLRQEIGQTYLPESNERTQLFHEFAEQGFDLVVLDLEMALEQLPPQGKVSTATLNIAKQTLQQLLQIGKDLEFDQGWIDLLRRSKVLLSRPENDFWRTHWFEYLRRLKDCARSGGVRKQGGTTELGEQGKQGELGEHSQSPHPLSLVPSPQPLAPQQSVQIPVPLERLDRSSQHLVDTLLTARASQGSYKTLQLQLAQLLTLAQDSVQYITRLRQVQDDYALLDLQGNRSLSTSPMLESYRQGYTIINRLLEISLRLSELGAETTTTARQTEDSLQLLDRNIINLQQTVEDSRLIPFKTLGFRAKGILRDLTNRYGKPAHLVVQGENIELDAGTVQNLEPALLHLLRNAYDHGLESAKKRVAAGKPEQGTIALSIRRQGKSYLLSLQDDGGGIDAKTIQKIAQDKKLPLTRTDTPADLLAVLTQPGFSSKTEVSEVSGRGVGMDVVAAQVSSLNGRLSLDTVVGKGTTFHLVIPARQMLVRCVLVQAGDRTFAIPAEEILTTTLWSNLSATQTVEPDAKYSWLIQQGKETVPGLDLLEYWQKETNARPLSPTAVCLSIRWRSVTSSTEQRDAWLLADDLLEQSELLINRLPHPLIAPVGLMGVSLQNNGKLIPVLEPATIAEELWTRPAEASQNKDGISLSELTPYVPPIKQDTSYITQTIYTILVVDDAALVRRRIEVSLTNYGYIVHTCRDGLEAWNWLQTHPAPSMIITDIEMPGMDGFTLINHCRQNGMKLPIMVVSSRLSEEWGKEARRLGATDYLTKGFTTPELLSKVDKLLGK